MQAERPARPQQRPPPPAYTQHDPQSLVLPSVPTHSLPSLPSLPSLDLPDARPTRASLELSPRTVHAQWSSSPLTSATFPRVPEGDLGSPMEVDRCSVASDRRRETSVVSVDDPDVRLAAEALSGLGNPDFARSPTTRSVTLSARSPPAEPEPLLNLLTSAHPWLGGGINTSISAYNTTKTYSPRFVKYGAELIERNIGSPVVNTVSSVGRRTGVEKNLRRYLGDGVHRRPSDLEQGDEGGRKRLRVMTPGGAEAMNVSEGPDAQRKRGGSLSSYTDSLPEYDDHRSPKYEESPLLAVDPVTGKEMAQEEGAPSQDRSVKWSTQLMMTTSGLGVALSESSLKSLRMCLGLLRNATEHIDSVMRALKQVLQEYTQAVRNDQPMSEEDAAATRGTDPKKDEQVRLIADRMKKLSSDIWVTLQKVVQYVSRYTGGALPQNASQVVRTQLLSVPQRWHLAARTTATDAEQQSGGEEVRGAHRMLAFAKEGLDMICQITTVVDGTVQSADAWLARIGRRPQPSNGAGDSHEKPPFPATEHLYEKQ